MKQVHSIAPVFCSSSRVLILGSFPSFKSREQGFFYGHAQNRFWRVLAAVTGEEIPGSVEEKKALLLRNGIALWDVVASCEVSGSADSSIKNVVPNDIGLILGESKIERIFTNGKTADSLYRRYIQPVTGREAVCLPSTSPANAVKSLDELVEAWKTLK